MKKFLDSVLGSGYLQFYRFFGEVNLRFRDWEMALGALSGPARLLAEVFLLQRAVGRKALEKVIGEDTLGSLVDLGILLVEKQKVRSDGFLLLQVQGFLYFCQITEEPFAYYGEDSLALTSFQSPMAEASVLDLCAGPGIQSLVASRRATKVTAVERNPKAAAVARWNLRLNGREDRVKVVNTSLEEFAIRNKGKSTFDQILFNPPLVPVPDAMDYHPAGHGGADGLEVIDRILEAYRTSLRPGGRFEFIGMTVCAAGESAVQAPLGRLLKRHRLAGRVHLLSRHALSRNSIVLGTVVNSLALSNQLDPGTAMERTLEFYRAHGYDEFYLYFCSVGRSGEGVTGLQEVDMSKTHFGGWFS